MKLDPTPTSHAQFAWIKLCLDETGAITTARVTETTSHEIGEGFRGAMMAWTFKPFMLGDHAIPACAMLRLAYPAGQGPAVETLPMPSPPKRGDVESIVFAPGVKDMIAKRIAGEKLIVRRRDEDSDQQESRESCHRHVSRVHGRSRRDRRRVADAIDGIRVLRSRDHHAHPRHVALLAVRARWQVAARVHRGHVHLQPTLSEAIGASGVEPHRCS